MFNETKGFLTVLSKPFYSFCSPSQERMELQHTAGETEIKGQRLGFNRYSGGRGYRKEEKRREGEDTAKLS